MTVEVDQAHGPHGVISGKEPMFFNFRALTFTDVSQCHFETELTVTFWSDKQIFQHTPKV